VNLVQILLPLFDNAGRRIARRKFDAVRCELTERFGGLTAYPRAPAEGWWRTPHRTQRDDIVVVEIMVARVDAAWWRRYRALLERRFRQQHIVIRSQSMRQL